MTNKGNKAVASAIFIIFLVSLLGVTLIADSSQDGLSQRIALPRYNPWLTDPKFSELSQEVVTQHTPWATPYAGRTMKLVVIAPRWTQRATVELQQRFDFDATTIMAYRSHTWGDTNGPHYYWISSGTEDIITERAMATIGARRRPDVIVIGWINCSIIPEKIQQEVIDAVTEGSGLVIYNPRPLAGKLKDFIEKCKPITDETLNAVVDSIPMGNLPPFKKRDSRGLIKKELKFYKHDSGGYVAVAMMDITPLSDTPRVTPDGLDFVGSNSYFSPQANKDVRDIHYDYYSSLAGRLILWAADNMPEVKLTGWEKLADQIDTSAGGSSLGSLIVDTKNLPAGTKAELTIRDFDSTVEYQSSLEISPDGQIALNILRLKTGEYYADVIIRNADGRSLDWGSKYFTTNTGARIVSITTDKKSHDPKKPIKVNITLDGKLSGAKVLAEVFDTHKRMIWAQTVDAKENLSIRPDFSEALTIMCNVRVTLSKDSVVLSQKTGKVLLRQPNPETDRYIYGIWASKWHEFVEKQAANVMVKFGVRGGIIGGEMDIWAESDVRPTPYVTRYYPENLDGKGLMVRKPCLTDPNFLKKEKDAIIKLTKDKKHYSPIGYSLGDDQGMMLTGQDACISQTCLPAFRKFLAKRHGNIKALNKSWTTNYTSFDQAEPLSLEDALKSGQYPRWAEHRMYMDQLFVDMHIWAKKIVRQVDPGARVGFEGPLMDDSWYGYEWKKLLDNLDFMAVYPNQWKFDIIRSFGRSNLISGGWHGGYAMYQNPDDLRSYPWYMLFNGCNSYWFFAGYGGSEAGHPAESIAPDLRPLSCFVETSKHVNRIQQGIDRLLLNSEPVNDKIAVYFSRPSVHGATVMPAIPTRDYNTDAKWSQYMAAPEMKWPLNIDANLRLLDDLGLSYVFVDSTDIAAGKLQKDNYSLLVMPLVHSMSAAEVKAVKKFVKAGGTVVADVRPGVFDEHIKLLKKGPLDDMFGIHRQGSAVMPLRDELIEMTAKASKAVVADAEAGAMLPENMDYVSEKIADKSKNVDIIPLPLDTTVSVKGGKAAAKTILGSPIFIKNKYSKGKAILMNVSIQHYLTLRAAGRGAGLRNLLRNALSGVDVVPDVQLQAVGDHSARVRVYRYDNQGDLLVGLLRPHKRLLDESDGFIDTKTHSFIINFGREGYIYDVINRKHYGRNDSLEIEIPIATALLFAVLPYEVTTVTAETYQDKQTVTISPAVKVSEGKAGKHVINVKVTDSNGRIRPEYSEPVIINNGSGSYNFNLAINDPLGKWTIALEDVATGTTGQATVQIK